jgi:hypothetical protein
MEARAFDDARTLVKSVRSAFRISTATSVRFEHSNPLKRRAILGIACIEKTDPHGEAPTGRGLTVFLVCASTDYLRVWSPPASVPTEKRNVNCFSPDTHRRSSIYSHPKKQNA